MQSKHWEIVWKVDEYQIRLTSEFFNKQKDNVFVKTRERRNVQRQGLDFSKEFIWKSIISCLLTTQQRSGPTSKVAQFLRTEPFLLNLEFCIKNIGQLEKIAFKILTEFGGIRRTSIIAQQIHDNLKNLNQNDWNILKPILENEVSNKDKYWERSLAERIQHSIVGFGPKQSRNFLQILGVTRYEVPIDSRITDWLNQNNFPIVLTAGGLSDLNYYLFVSDGVQHLCEQANIYPCLLDAAIFSSYDKENWTDENSVF